MPKMEIINAELEKKLDLSVNGLNLSTTVILISCKWFRNYQINGKIWNID
jgi:hypothetical protein